MKKAVAVFIIIISLVVLWLVFNGVAVDKHKYIVQVNGVGIQKTAYDKELVQSMTFFKSQNQDVSKLPTLQKDTLDELVDESLINQYAAKNKITVLDTEVDARYLQVVAGYNRRNKIAETGDSQFLAKIKEMYLETKSDYLQTLREDILKEKVQVSVGMPLATWLKIQKQSAQIKIFQ